MLGFISSRKKVLVGLMNITLLRLLAVIYVVANGKHVAIKAAKGELNFP